ncbi:LacI family DNA-binding transcriptional regulator [Kiloniella laminariae]|uniref:LacI family DNA-binding transcriptional regulator n=1 Tax=Kiloniella laminariae TaxID=454162 RepID=UPI00035D8C76|nr:LacI family DNA-binding transcriptional regulator [Kiloniella laminariae]
MARVKNVIRVTVGDVAELAGVSRSAVSRTFTPGAPVSAGTRERVLSAAKELGYRPNALARSLTQSHTNIVAIVMGEFDNPFQPWMFDALTRHLHRGGKMPMLVTVDSTGDPVEPIFRALDFRVDVLVVAAGSLPDESVAACIESGVPVIMLGRSVETDIVDVVLSDNHMAGAQAATTLINSGHQRLAYVGGSENRLASKERGEGFVQALNGMDCPLSQMVFCGSYSYQSGYEAALSMLTLDKKIDGIFCASDSLAFGVMDAVRDHLGLKIPQDLSVMGMDDVPMSAWPGYGLTTIRQPVNKIAEFVLERIDYWSVPGEKKPVLQRIPTELIVRNSVRLG